MARFTGSGLSFQYPAGWRARSWQDVSSFSALITYLSSTRLHNPCTETVTATFTRASCGYPIQQLPDGAILVTWTADGSPAGPGSTKVNATIGGLPAVLTTSVPGSCAEIGADATVTAQIVRPGADNWYTMTACMRAPSLHADELAVAAMLRSVRFSAAAR